MVMKKFGIISSIILLPILSCFTASAADTSGLPSSVGDTTITMSADTACVGITVANTIYTNRWTDDATASEISYEEEVNAIYGTTRYVKKLDTDTENAPNLDVDTNLAFVADPAGGRLVSSEEVGLQVVTNSSDGPSETPSSHDLSSLCPWQQDPDPGPVDEIPVSNEAAAMGSDMNVSIVQASTAATVGTTGSERSVSYAIDAAGPQATGGYGVGTIGAEMKVEVQKDADNDGWKPSDPVYVGPENPTTEQLSDPNNYKVPETPTSPSSAQYQQYQDSLTSSGVWTFSKAMEYISENH